MLANSFCCDLHHARKGPEIDLLLLVLIESIERGIGD